MSSEKHHQVIIGHDQEREIIRETMLKPLPPKYQQQQQQQQRPDSRTCLITSFAGTGKTMVLKDIEHQMQQLMMMKEVDEPATTKTTTNTSSSSSLSSSKFSFRYVNAAELIVNIKNRTDHFDNPVLANIDDFFSSAIETVKRDRIPVILCIDDVDCFFETSTTPRSNVSEARGKFLQYLDEISLMNRYTNTLPTTEQENNNNNNNAENTRTSSASIVVFCSSVHPQRLDVSAIHRFSRRLVLKSLFSAEELVKVAKLDLSENFSASTEVLQFLESHLNESRCSFLSSSLETSTSFFTPADIRGLIRDAAMQAIRDAIETKKQQLLEREEGAQAGVVEKKLTALLSQITEQDIRKTMEIRDLEIALSRFCGSMQKRDYLAFEEWRKEYGVGQNLIRGCSLHFR